MRIGIDGIVLRGKDAGSLRYFEQLITGLAKFGGSHAYVIFADRRVLPSAAISQQGNFLCRNVNAASPLPAALRQQLFRAWHVRGKIDLLHSPVSAIPLWFDAKTVMTVQDLAFEVYPEAAKWTGRLWFHLFVRRGAEKATRIIAISESTKRDLVRCYGISAEKIGVVYHCLPTIFRAVTNRKEIAAKYRLPEKYILYVGTLERRKNIANLIRAFAAARRIGTLPHVLVLAGQRGWLYEDIFRTVEELNLKDQVIFLGYVPDEDLPGLYSAADLFVYLSRYEGFGLPVLEAMACGTPVLASNASSLPEVIGDAGIMVPPDDVEQAAVEMVRLLTDRALRGTMIERGLRWASTFSQERFIRQTLQVYDEAICVSA
jgi:glycosyltransferase involved in cell wall biosynthesis